MKFIIHLAFIIITTQVLACNNSSVSYTTDSFTPPDTAIKIIDNAQAQKLIHKKNITILDVRTPQEYAQGHLPNAVNIDINGNNFSESIAKLDKNKPYVVYCAAGVRSSNASNQMKDKGFINIYNLKSGFNNWNGPVAK